MFKKKKCLVWDSHYSLQWKLLNKSISQMYIIGLELCYCCWMNTKKQFLGIKQLALFYTPLWRHQEDLPPPSCSGLSFFSSSLAQKPLQIHKHTLSMKTYALLTKQCGCIKFQQRSVERALGQKHTLCKYTNANAWSKRASLFNLYYLALLLKVLELHN